VVPESEGQTPLPEEDAAEAIFKTIFYSILASCKKDEREKPGPEISESGRISRSIRAVADCPQIVPNAGSALVVSLLRSQYHSRANLSDSPDSLTKPRWSAQK